MMLSFKNIKRILKIQIYEEVKSNNPEIIDSN